MYNNCETLADSTHHTYYNGAMVGVNIYYCLLKVVYGWSSSEVNIWSCLAPITILFAIRHGYKYALEKTY